MATFGWCIDGFHTACRRVVASGSVCSCYCHDKHTRSPEPPLAAQSVEFVPPPSLHLPPGVTITADGTIRVHDDTGALHSAVGPAVSYPDGSFEYWWHGAKVSAADHTRHVDNGDQ